VLRHDHVTSDCKKITQPNALQRILKKLHRRDRRQVGPTLETAEGEEVKVSRLLITDALALIHCEDTPTGGGGVVLPSRSQRLGTGGTLIWVWKGYRAAATRLRSTPSEPNEGQTRNSLCKKNEQNKTTADLQVIE